MMRILLPVVVLVTFLGVLALVTRASDRPEAPSVHVGPRLLTEPECALPPPDPIEGEVDCSVPEDIEEPAEAPLSTEQRFLAIEQDQRAREESCRIAEDVLREGDLGGLKSLFAAYARTRDPRIRAGVLRAIRLSTLGREGIDWAWLEASCPVGAEGVAARIGIRVGLGRHGACLWLARAPDVVSQRGLIDAVLDGLSPQEGEELADGCRREAPSPGLDRLLMRLEE